MFYTFMAYLIAARDGARKGDTTYEHARQTQQKKLDEARDRTQDADEKTDPIVLPSLGLLFYFEDGPDNEFADVIDELHGGQPELHSFPI